MLTKNEAAYQALTKKFSKALIAEFCGISRQAMTKWTKVPRERVAILAEKTGLPPEVILPEPYSAT